MITTALAKYYTMRIKEILVEYARAPLYHGTSIKNAENILNECYLSWLRVGSHSEGQISLSRNFANARMFAYGENEPGVVFVLDQDALKQTLGRKLKPYDWQSGTQGGEDEDEEAVFSQTNVPINSKTIIEIIVMVDANLIKWDKDIELALTKKYPKVFENLKTRVYVQNKTNVGSYRQTFNQSPTSLTTQAETEKQVFPVINAYIKKIGSEDFSKYTLKDIQAISKNIGGSDLQSNMRTVAKSIGRTDLVS